VAAAVRRDPDRVGGEVFRAGDTVRFGVRAFEGFEPNDLVLYVESRGAVVVGDTLIDRGNGLEVHPEWPGAAVSAPDVVHRLRALLDPPIDVLLPAHADPAGRAAPARAPCIWRRAREGAEERRRPEGPRARSRSMPRIADLPPRTATDAYLAEIGERLDIAFDVDLGELVEGHRVVGRGVLNLPGG